MNLLDAKEQREMQSTRYTSSQEALVQSMLDMVVQIQTCVERMPSPRKLQSGDNEALVKGSTSPIGSVRAPLGYRGEIWTTSLEQKLSALRLINQSLEQSPPAESHVGRSSSVA